jgi:hypothetical protein
MGLRNTKNVQSAVGSAIYVGLRAEHLHATDMHATNFHSDEGMDIFAEIKALREELEQTKAKLALFDIDAVDLAEGDVLVYSAADKKWRPTELKC